MVVCVAAWCFYSILASPVILVRTMSRIVGAVWLPFLIDANRLLFLVAPRTCFSCPPPVHVPSLLTPRTRHCPTLDASSQCALQYTMNVSSRGSEGLFSSLASAPLFSVKLVVGAMSGVLLSDYCPSYGDCDGRHLWSIVGATSLLSPILMIFLRSCIESRESEDRGDVEDAPARAAVKAAAATAGAGAGAGGASKAPVGTEASALLPRSRAYPPPAAGAVRVGGAAAQGKAVVAKSRPMAIPDDP